MLQASDHKAGSCMAAAAQQAAASGGSRWGLVPLDAALDSGSSKTQKFAGLGSDDVHKGGVQVCNLSLSMINHRVVIGHVPLPPHSTCRGNKEELRMTAYVYLHADQGVSAKPNPG